MTVASSSTHRLGDSLVKPDAAAKASGEADYVEDLRVENALEAMAVFTNQPHARILSLDTSAAEALEGVVAVLVRDGRDLAALEACFWR